MSVESFDASWLALREPVDHRSRPGTLLPPLVAWWTDRGASEVLDLGAGTGSNLRYLAPRLPGPQSWTEVDHDARLLERVASPRDDVRVVTRREDLANPSPRLAEHADLVTASALLDLVSERWLERLADACASAGAAALFALTYDGRVAWEDGDRPAEPSPEMDARVLDAVNAHQGGDKGFGPALGPYAGSAAEAAFRARGYRTWSLDSPWVLGSADGPLADALIGGWAGAAAELHPDEAEGLRAWAVRRAAGVRAGTTRLTVGHVDLLALP